uniref:ATP-dependent DNA helicase n=1 Tax=Panagrolaimus superbus TaxID=310955 RepID=A0A914YTW1_9BILA
MIKTFDGENFECRYGFPKRSREYTKLNFKKGKLFEDKSMGWRQYELKRKLNEDLIGDYNLVLLLLWKGNINVQVLISGNNSKLIQYLTKSMPAKSLSQCEQVNNRITKNLSMTNVAKIGAQFLQNKPLGSVEIVEHLLGMPLCGSSFNVLFINTNAPEKRRKMLATKIEPENLTPENVYQTTMLDNYMPGRDVYLQKFGYYNIAAYFKIVRRDEVDQNSKTKETENREVDENVEDTDDENFIDETDYSNLCNPPDLSQFSQLSDIPSQTSTSATSATPSYIPSKEDILAQQKYGGNPFLKAGYSIFDEKSPTFCHPKIKAGTIFSSGCEKIFFLKRSKPKIPRFYLGYFDEDNFDKVNDYFRRLCIKFIPFDKEEDLKSDEDGYIKKFIDFFQNLFENYKAAANDILRITKNYHERIQLQFEAAVKLENQINEEIEEFGIEIEIDEIEKENVKQLAWLKISEIDKNLHQKMIKSLNQIQAEIFDDTVTIISEQENLKTTNNFEENEKQIISFISGVAGTGKSHLIKTLSHHLILSYTNVSEQFSAPPIIIGAPTAYAALPLHGNTIHSIFSLGESFSRFKPMTSEMASEKKVLFDNCKLIIIDEISMCSNVTLMQINLRCQEITGEKCDYCTIYSKALERLRIGATIEEDFEMFKSRIIEPAKNGEKPTFLEMAQYYLTLCEKSSSNVMAIFPKVNDVNLFNAAVMKCKNLNIINIFAKNSIDSGNSNKKNITKPWRQKSYVKNKISKFMPWSKSTSLSAQYPSGKTKLPELIRVAIGCRIVLKKNLDMSNGLINGALGILKDVKSHEILTKNDGIQIYVDKLLIEFDHALGRNYEISRDTVSYANFKGSLISRSQFPVSVAYSCTIHKGQGASLETVMVSLENLFEGGQAYVALSRVKTLEGLHISVWDERSFKVNTKAIIEYNRLRETINLPPFTIPNQNEIISSQTDTTLMLQGNGKLPILILVNENDKQNCINSTLQILRIIPNFLQWLQTCQLQTNLLNEIKEIFEYIGKNESANTEKFENTVSDLDEEATYIPEKLIQLILNNCEKEIKNLWQLNKKILAKCGYCTLEYEIPNEPINILKLVLPQSLEKLTFNELLDLNENFQEIRQCLKCSKMSPHQIKITLSWPSQFQAKYLFVSLDRYNRQESKAALKLTEHHQKGKQKIGGKLWNFIGAIEHNGASKFTGSYTPWLCDENDERKRFWHKICVDKSFEIFHFNINLSNILLYKSHC